MLLLLLFMCNWGYAITDKQQNEKVTTTAIRTRRLSNLCRLVFVLLLFLLLLYLLMLLLNFVVVQLLLEMHNDRYTTTTKLQSNNNSEQKDQSDTFPFQLSRDHYMLRCTPSRGIWWQRVVLCQVSLTGTVRCKVSLTFASDIPRSDVPPGTGIWWPRVVLH